MICNKECIYCEERCVLLKNHHPVMCKCERHMDSFKKPKITVTIQVGDIQASVTRPMLAEMDHDNEENAARLADQLARATVQRFYNK